MKVLLDTCVLSEIRKPHGEKSVKEAVNQIPDSSLFISVITIGEIVKGIDLLVDNHRKNRLQAWIQYLENGYSSSILPIDLETVHIWGVLTANAQKAGRSIPVADGLIAATTIRYDLHLMTRNTSDFEHTGARLINPWLQVKPV